jgi:hypothetical protein
MVSRWEMLGRLYITVRMEWNGQGREIFMERRVGGR